MKRVINLIFLIPGTIIGAGFASGKELCTFFLRYGDRAYWYAAAACVLFFVAFYLILTVTNRVGGGIEQFHSDLYGRLYGIGVLILLTNNMLVIASMLGAFDVIVPYAPLGGILGALLCLFVLLSGRKGLERCNVIAVPLLVILLLTVSISGIICAPSKLEIAPASGGILQSMLYVGMNVLTLGSVLSGTKTSKKERLIVSIVATILIGCLIFAEIMVIRCYDVNIYNTDMPMLTIADAMGMGILARIVLGLGIFTTLAACAHTVAEWMLPVVKSRAVALAVILAIGYAVSRFGFGNIVSVLYPVLGAIGLIELCACGVSQGKACYRLRRRTSALL